MYVNASNDSCAMRFSISLRILSHVHALREPIATYVSKPQTITFFCVLSISSFFLFVVRQPRESHVTQENHKVNDVQSKYYVFFLNASIGLFTSSRNHREKRIEMLRKKQTILFFGLKTRCNKKWREPVLILIPIEYKN